MEKIGYVLLLVVAACWLIGMVAGMIAAFPLGVIGLLAIVGIGLRRAPRKKERCTAFFNPRFAGPLRWPGPSTRFGNCEE